MDDSIRTIFKQIFTTLKYTISEETIREKEDLIQFKLERGGIFCIVSYFDNRPLCEMFFPCPYTNPNDITKLSELLKEQEFLFELQKLLTAPNLFYHFDINEGKFSGFSVFIQLFKKVDDIQLSEFSNAISMVVNYGLLGHSYILLKLGKNRVEEKTITENQKNLDNPMFS